MRVFLTGASGYIGGAVAVKLVNASAVVLPCLSGAGTYRHFRSARSDTYPVQKSGASVRFWPQAPVRRSAAMRLLSEGDPTFGGPAGTAAPDPNRTRGPIRLGADGLHYLAPLVSVGHQP